MKYSTVLLAALAAIVGMTDGRPKIIGSLGQRADARNYPSYVFIQSVQPMPNIPGVVEIIYCGGTIVSQQFALTAYHCVSNNNRLRPAEQFKLWVGLQTISLDERHLPMTPSEPFLQAERIISYPGSYLEERDVGGGNSLSKLLHDIALIKLAQTPAMPSLTPIGLPTYQTVAGMPGIAVGFGETHKPEEGDARELQQLQATVTDEETCLQKYGNVASSGIFCIEASDHYSDTCQGDSGGPFYVGNQLYGVTSFGSEDCGGLGVFTDVSKYTQWIQQIIQNEDQQNQGPEQFGWWWGQGQ